jgi:hypothetical protein
MDRFFDTAAASAWLGERGIRRSPKTLRKLRVIGGGPRFRRLNGQVFYTEAALEEWLRERVSPEYGSTSEAAASGGDGD